MAFIHSFSVPLETAWHFMPDMSVFSESGSETKLMRLNLLKGLRREGGMPLTDGES